MRKLINFVCLILILIVLSNCGRAKNQEIEAVAALLNNGQYQEATIDLEKLLINYPYDPRLYYLLGFSYLKLDKYNLSLVNLDQALAKKRNYSQVVGDVGLANFLSGNSPNIGHPRFKLAERELGKIIKDNQGSEKAKEIGYHLAYLYLVKDEYLKALNQFQQVVSWSPASPVDAGIYLEIGRIYLDKLENYTKGEEALRELANRYAGTDEAAEGLLAISDSYRKRMEMYHKRARALTEFVSNWQGKEQLVEEVKEASAQARQDLQIARDLQAKALEVLDLFLVKYKNHLSSAQAYRNKLELEQPLSASFPR